MLQHAKSILVKRFVIGHIASAMDRMGNGEHEETICVFQRQFPNGSELLFSIKVSVPLLTSSLLVLIFHFTQDHIVCRKARRRVNGLIVIVNIFHGSGTSMLGFNSQQGWQCVSQARMFPHLEATRLAFSSCHGNTAKCELHATRTTMWKLVQHTTQLANTCMEHRLTSCQQLW